MKPASLLAILLLSSLLLPVRPGAAMPGHCSPFTTEPVAGEAGAIRVTTSRGSILARRGPQRLARTAAQAVAVFRVFPNSFDADGDTLGTVRDTILVAPGTIVRWERRGPAFHTITNGADSGDPNAAFEYSAIFDDLTLSYERVFTVPGRHDFFCFIHEPVMLGSIIVTTATAGVGGPGVIREPMFTRPPSPNPARGPVTFAIALPRSGRARVQVLDVSGRLVARVFDDALPAGEHTLRWDGRTSDGRIADSGRYFLQLQAGDKRVTRTVVRMR